MDSINSPGMLSKPGALPLFSLCFDDSVSESRMSGPFSSSTTSFFSSRLQVEGLFSASYNVSKYSIRHSLIFFCLSEYSLVDLGRDLTLFFKLS